MHPANMQSIPQDEERCSLLREVICLKISLLHDFTTAFQSHMLFGQHASASIMQGLLDVLGERVSHNLQLLSL